MVTSPAGPLNFWPISAVRTLSTSNEPAFSTACFQRCTPMRERFIGLQVTRPLASMPLTVSITPVTLGDLSQAWKSLTNFLFSGVLIDMKYVQQPRCPTKSFAGKPRNSSSEIEKETTGQFSDVRPALANSLKNGTFVSPL